MPHLLLVGAGSLVAAALFGRLAWQLGHREIDPAVRLAAVAFAVAWAAFSFEALNDALRVTIGVWALPDTAVYFALARFKIIAAAIAIWGFGVYVVYLWRGSVRYWNAALIVFAASHAFYFLYALEGRDPIDVMIGTWAPRMQFASESNLPQPWRALALPYFFVPPMLLAAFYLLLVRRLESRTQRFRVVAVGSAILLFHVTNLFQSNPNVSPDGPIWPAIIVLNVFTGLLAYGAYHPPAWLRRRLDVTDLAHESPTRSRTNRAPAGRAARRS